MRLQIEPTDRIVVVNGAPCRAWRGVSEEGTPCVVFVVSVAVEHGPGAAAFEAELRELPLPVPRNAADLLVCEVLRAGEPEHS